MLLYHVGPKIYPDLRTLEYQTGSETAKERIKQLVDNPLKYFRELNTFAGPVTNKHVRLMRNNGFVNWSSSKLYLYTIDLLAVKHLINSINITSTPEQNKYDADNWPIFYKEHLGKSDQEWMEGKRKYLSLRKKYLDYIGQRTDLTVNECIDRVSKSNWDDMDYYFKLNSIHGNKKQYASEIPHIQLDTKGPIPYVSVVEIK